MKRILFDVPRWYIYLHRREAGLPLVDDYDEFERMVADEIFGKLYAGDLEKLDPEVVKKLDEEDVERATSVHAQVDAIENFNEAAKRCRGNYKKSAETTKQILDDLREKAQANQDLLEDMRQQVSGAPPTGTDRDVADGLNQVSVPGTGEWTGEWKDEAAENERAKSLADKLKDNEKLKKIALLAGKFKRIMLSKQKAKVRRGSDEISDVTQGADIARLLPSELVKLAHPRYRLAAMRDVMERKCLQYEMTSTEVLGRGPLVLCLDKSSSMNENEGMKDIWASAIALALLDMAQRQHRHFIILGFNEKVPQRVAVSPGEMLPASKLLYHPNGGTDITNVLDLALGAVESREIMKRADIILITDGESDVGKASWIKQRAKNRDVRIDGIGIGVKKRALKPWCDEIHCVTDLSVMDEDLSLVLFDR